MLNTYFPSEAWEPGYVPGKGAYPTSPIKALGIESPVNFPSWQHDTCIVTTCD